MLLLQQQWVWVVLKTTPEGKRQKTGDHRVNRLPNAAHGHVAIKEQRQEHLNITAPPAADEAERGGRAHTLDR